MADVENALALPNAPGALPTGKAAGKTPGRVLAPHGAVDTPLGPQSAKGRARLALGDISNRAARANQAPATMGTLKSLAMADANKFLDLPPIEKMHPSTPASAPCLDDTGAELEAQVNALLARGPCDLGCGGGASDVPLASLDLPDGPPTPAMLRAPMQRQFVTTAPAAGDVGVHAALTSGGAHEGTQRATCNSQQRGPPHVARISVGAATPPGASLEVELDLSSLKPVPPTPFADDTEDEDDHDRRQSPAPNESLAKHLASLML